MVYVKDNAYSISQFSKRFLSPNTVIRIEYLTSNEFIFQGTIKELKNTLDADLRMIVEYSNIKQIIPTMTLSAGMPVSITFLI